jgi:hypothetical protein
VKKSKGLRDFRLTQNDFIHLPNIADHLVRFLVPTARKDLALCPVGNIMLLNRSVARPCQASLLRPHRCERWRLPVVPFCLPALSSKTYPIQVCRESCLNSFSGSSTWLRALLRRRIRCVEGHASASCPRMRGWFQSAGRCYAIRMTKLLIEECPGPELALMRGSEGVMRLRMSCGAAVPCSSTIGQLPINDLCVLVAQMRPSRWGRHDHGYFPAVLRVRFAVQLKQIFLLKHNPH